MRLLCRRQSVCRLSRRSRSVVLASMLLLAFGCAERIDGVTGPVAPQGGQVGVDGDGEITVVVDATDKVNWRYFRLDGAEVVAPKDPDTSLEWDLAFLRAAIRVNGGTSGPGGVEVGWVDPPEPLELPTEWVTDTAEALVFDRDGAWYDYDVTTHILTARDRVWFVRANDGVVYRLVFFDYYDDFGTSGLPSFVLTKHTDDPDE